MALWHSIQFTSKTKHQLQVFASFQGNPLNKYIYLWMISCRWRFWMLILQEESHSYLPSFRLSAMAFYNNLQVTLVGPWSVCSLAVPVACPVLNLCTPLTVYEFNRDPWQIILIRYTFVCRTKWQIAVVLGKFLAYFSYGILWSLSSGTGKYRPDTSGLHDRSDHRNELIHCMRN